MPGVNNTCCGWLAGLLNDEPDSFTALVLRGQRSPAQLVDRFGVTDPGVRLLLIDYVTEISTTSDYGSLDNTSWVLVNLFWRVIQDHHPGQATIALTQEQAAGWKERVKTLPDGTPRRNAYSVLRAVPSFYLDIAAWAHEDPARWAPWAMPCPISVRDVRGYQAQRRRTTEHMQDRTRTLAPHLPRLAVAARSRHRESLELLPGAKAAAVDETFTVAGRTYRRLPLFKGASATTIRLSSPIRKGESTRSPSRVNGSGCGRRSRCSGTPGSASRRCSSSLT